jgi:Terminase large subunit, T4likevirus-type, N-terminal
MPPAPAPSLRVPIKESAFWPAYGVSVPQAAFLSLPHMEALYGGAAGGGKSDALLRAALQYVEFPGYKAILLRKTFAQLAQSGGLIDRSKEWLTGKASWNETKHRWTFPSGAILEFGHLQHENDRFNYQGSEFDFIGFDELTHFSELEYRYLFSRLRQQPGSPIPPRVRAASNPGGKGHRWVKRRFIDKRPDPEDESETPERCAERIFIPAKVADNPGINQDAYEAALRQLDPQEQEQLLDGNWDARPPGDWVFDAQAIDAVVARGRDFDRLREKGKLPAPILYLGSRRVKGLSLGVDWGDFATRGVVGWELERGGLYLPPGLVKATRSDVEDITEDLLEAAGQYPYWLGEQRYDASFAQSNRTFARIARQRFGQHNPIKERGRPNTYPVPFGEFKALTVRYLRLLLRRTLNEEITRVLAISPENVELIEQMRDYQEDEFDRFQKGNDDAVDALIADAAPIARRWRSAIEEEAEKAKTPPASELSPAASRAATKGRRGKAKAGA